MRHIHAPNINHIFSDLKSVDDGTNQKREACAVKFHALSKSMIIRFT